MAEKGDENKHIPEFMDVIFITYAAHHFIWWKLTFGIITTLHNVIYFYDCV